MTRQTLQRAHPRSRGENLVADGVHFCVPGSSPLTRGKRARWRLGLLFVRLIPAHAGKTSPGQGRPRRSAAHPRSRGENEIARAEDVNANGSSPLTRGKHVAFVVHKLANRLIPAHAGKTKSVLVTGIARAGSSPLTRGKHHHAARGDQQDRLIPAHAGKTAQDGLRRQSQPAHPRSRGENVLADTKRFRSGGSSPLTRGKPRKARTAAPPARLIPAHAGKTLPGGFEVGGQRAHPRSRGENFRCSFRLSAEAGSSPLTRGKRAAQAVQMLCQGLIPAHAGKTAS